MFAIAWLSLVAMGQAPEDPTLTMGTDAGPEDPLIRKLEVTPEGYRASYDVTLYVRRDGNLFLEDDLVLDIDLAREVARVARLRGPQARVVVAADAEADYSRVVEVLDLVQSAGVGRVALEIGDAVAAHDPLFPGIENPTEGGDVVNLDQTNFSSELEEYHPRRHKFPQNPYAQTDFTAYTREWGEAKLGLSAFSYGILPRVQVSTAPPLLAFGILNAQAKGNFLRLGPWDAALTGLVCVVPITNLLRTVDRDGVYNIGGVEVEDKDIFVDRMTYVSFNLQNSLQIVGGWSIHAGIGYSRGTARGNLDLYNLPVIALPGLEEFGGQVALVPSVVGELIDARVATDYRFNRRDSIVFQAAQTVYGSARGSVSPNVEELPDELQGVNNLDFLVRFDGLIPWYQTLRMSLAWQFSWARVDLRLGAGYSWGVPLTWLMQSVDIAYRFGGKTRRTESVIKRGYRKDQRDLGAIDSIKIQEPNPETPPPPGGHTEELPDGPDASGGEGPILPPPPEDPEE